MDTLLLLLGFVAGIVVADKIKEAQLEAEFNRGYDEAVSTMTQFGYWNEPDHGTRHNGTWIEKGESENNV